MLPMYSEACFGEGDIHDTAMLRLAWRPRLLCALDVITPYFGSIGTGQVNAVFPVLPL